MVSVTLSRSPAPVLHPREFIELIALEQNRSESFLISDAKLELGMVAVSHYR